MQDMCPNSWCTVYVHESAQKGSLVSYAENFGLH